VLGGRVHKAGSERAAEGDSIGADPVAGIDRRDDADDPAVRSENREAGGDSYPEAARLMQPKGMGPLTALAFLLLVDAALSS
jgi:hypothetical protein